MILPKLGRIQILAAIPLILALSGCGNGNTTSGEGQSDGSSKAMVYEIDETINGVHCKYQSPTYHDWATYCAALQDSSLNQDNGIECGRDYRHTLFDQNINCDGDFNPTQVILTGVGPGPR